LYVTNTVSIRKVFLKGTVDSFLIKKPLDFISKSASILSDEIIIPDFPPSNTVCHYTLSNIKRIKKKTFFVGPVVKKGLYTTKPIKTKKNTVLSIIGGHTYRKPLVDCVVKAASLNKNFNFIIISRLIKRHVKKDNLELLPFVENVYSYLKGSDLIISQSGHSTVMEMICSGKTGVIIPDKKQYEQESIARRVKEMNLFRTMTYDNLKPKILIKNLEILTEDKKYKKNVLKLSELSKKLNGPKKIADIAIDYSSRMRMKY
jgi:UDP-N-acetylglucosamine--N-acetylmuramyl-(pentapeptide) pyrophosphoryl-undecaprenol N-acetylglucosamine transferase